jgi:4-hydroxybenzoate polyprenyltransferase
MTSFFTSLWKELRWVVRISRPRFWLYLFGPFLIGLVAAIRIEDWVRLDFLARVRALRYFQEGLFAGLPLLISNLWREQPELLLGIAGMTILLLGYFLFPANLLLYGVNDLFDVDTDALNPKKQGYESRLSEERIPRLIVYIVLAQIPWILLALSSLAFSPFSPIAVVPGLLLCLFFFFAIFYSAPPIRAKARPFLDSAFNTLYLLPGLISYVSLSPPVNGFGVDFRFPWHATLAGACWCMAMHAYSAVPDIEADTGAGLRTIATELGARKTLLLCAVLYATSAVIVCFTVNTMGLRYVFLLLGIFYVILMYISLTRIDDLMPIYKRFPLVNTFVGMILFFALLLG